MKAKFSIFLLCVLSLGLASCKSTPQRRVTTASTLRKGTVTAVANPGQVASQTVTVWNSGDGHACDVTVSYQGEDACEAHLEYVSPADNSRNSSGTRPVQPNMNFVV